MGECECCGEEYGDWECMEGICLNCMIELVKEEGRGKEYGRRRFTDLEICTVFLLAKGRCGYCPKKLSLDNYGRRDGAWGAWEIDHVRPVIDGGSNRLKNLKAACINCQKDKGPMPPKEWMNRSPPASIIDHIKKGLGMKFKRKKGSRADWTDDEDL